MDDSRATDDTRDVDTDGGRPTGSATDPAAVERATDDAEPTDRDGAWGLAAVENWTPPTDARAGAAVRRHLAADESLRHADAAWLLGDDRGPAAVGLTDDRLLAVTDDGGFVCVGLDRVGSVRSRPRTTFTLRGSDHRLVLGVGLAVALVGALGVVGAAASALSPVLALVTVAGTLAADRVRRVGVDFDDALAALERHERDTDLADRLRSARRRTDADDDLVAATAAGGLAVVSFVALLAVESGLAVPAAVLATLAGVGVAGYAVRHSESFDGLELVCRRQRAVTVALDGGGVVAVRTHPDSTLDRELAGLAVRSGE